MRQFEWAFGTWDDLVVVLRTISLAQVPLPPQQSRCDLHIGTSNEGGIQLARFANSLPTCRYAAALVEQGPHPQPHSARKTKGPEKGPLIFLAERVGFEPTVRENRTPDFESGPFDHSGTSPLIAPVGQRIVRNGCKVGQN